jgi:C4-dicarboxylate-specific signal transduction histidine kinase
LRLHQESLARLARLGSIGELAAAVAHEVNQPLMAAGTYTRLVAETIGSQEGDSSLAVEAAKKAVEQVDRATQVTRRLRALVRLDRSNRAPYHLEQIVRETITLCEPDLERVGVMARSALPARLPSVMVDILQIQQVLLNLLRNSIEAIGESGTVDGSILIEAKLSGAEFLEVIVADSGPGFPPERMENAFLPLSSNKPEGLGIGLSLCRSIIEAHGGVTFSDEAIRGSKLDADSQRVSATCRQQLPSSGSGFPSRQAGTACRTPLDKLHGEENPNRCRSLFRRDQLSEGEASPVASLTRAMDSNCARLRRLE